MENDQHKKPQTLFERIRSAMSSSVKKSVTNKRVLNNSPSRLIKQSNSGASSNKTEEKIENQPSGSNKTMLPLSSLPSEQDKTNHIPRANLKNLQKNNCKSLQRENNQSRNLSRHNHTQVVNLSSKQPDEQDNLPAKTERNEKPRVNQACALLPKVQNKRTPSKTSVLTSPRKTNKTCQQVKTKSPIGKTTQSPPLSVIYRRPPSLQRPTLQQDTVKNRPTAQSSKLHARPQTCGASKPPQNLNNVAFANSLKQSSNIPRNLKCEEESNNADTTDSQKLAVVKLFFANPLLEVNCQNIEHHLDVPTMQENDYNKEEPGQSPTSYEPHQAMPPTPNATQPSSLQRNNALHSPKYTTVKTEASVKSESPNRQERERLHEPKAKALQANRTPNDLSFGHEISSNQKRMTLDKLKAEIQSNTLRRDGSVPRYQNNTRQHPNRNNWLAQTPKINSRLKTRLVYDVHKSRKEFKDTNKQRQEATNTSATVPNQELVVKEHSSDCDEAERPRTTLFDSDLPEQGVPTREPSTSRDRQESATNPRTYRRRKVHTTTSYPLTKRGASETNDLLSNPIRTQDKNVHTPLIREKTFLVLPSLKNYTIDDERTPIPLIRDRTYLVLPSVKKSTKSELKVSKYHSGIPLLKRRKSDEMGSDATCCLSGVPLTKTSTFLIRPVSENVRKSHDTEEIIIPLIKKETYMVLAANKSRSNNKISSNS